MLTDLNYLSNKPSATGQYKQQCEDFIVKEDLGFDLTGEGEHVLVYVQKRNANTAFVAEQLAKYVGISPKLVSYAGLKDRQALSEQWFSLHMPGQTTPDFTDFNLEGCQLLQVTRHNKKLKIGALKGNHFSLILNEISDKDEVEKKLLFIEQNGVPNYFGEQRFGRDDNNLTQAIKWAQGEIQVKDRKKRSFYLSAARSAIFNAIVSERINNKLFNQVLNGDALQLADRGSWFVTHEADRQLSQQRLQEKQLNITAPMLGDLPLGTEAEALKFELNCLENWHIFEDLFKKERLETARRSILLMPKALKWQWQTDNQLVIHFYLNAGSYATSILRELIIRNNG